MYLDEGHEGETEEQSIRMGEKGLRREIKNTVLEDQTVMTVPKVKYYFRTSVSSGSYSTFTTSFKRNF